MAKTDHRIEEVDQIDAAPTKLFFVEMLTKDIPLEQAVLDLVDNSVDGAKSIDQKTFVGRTVEITLNKDEFRIVDNCGGFSKDVARSYAFRFGRPPGTPRTPHSVGQFGVGMKRALFKFGNHFVVSSATSDEKWAVDVPVDKWLNDPDNWHFSWSEWKITEISKENPGTDIRVDKLRDEVANRFATPQFENAIRGLIKSKHRQFIANGLQISVNEKSIDATNLYLLVQDQQLRPGVDNLTFGSGSKAVKVHLTVGVGPSSPREAGWYVVCNGRVILEADRRDRTGWGILEAETDRIVIPSYHNQFARFRGIVSFDSKDSSQLPWNTTKTDVDDGNQTWQKTFQRMTEMMRPVISFLNELDKDIDEFTRDGSALFEFVTKAAQLGADALTKKSEFRAPKRESLKRSFPTIKVQYSRALKDVQFLERELGVTSAKAVGEKTFDTILKRHREK